MAELLLTAQPLLRLWHEQRNRQFFVFFPVHFDAHTNLYVSQRVLDADHVGYESRAFIQVDPRNRIGDVLPKKRVVALTYHAVGINGPFTH